MNSEEKLLRIISWLSANDLKDEAVELLALLSDYDKATNLIGGEEIAPRLSGDIFHKNFKTRHKIK